jgi:uncharacterized protein (UPF0264 family)
VAYADWSRAGSPPPEVICVQAARLPLAVLLVDTFQKDGRTLLDWLTLAQLAQLCRHCHCHGLKIALAGSLARDEIVALRGLRPDWFAVRGAACRGGSREGQVDKECVADLKELMLDMNMMEKTLR